MERCDDPCRPAAGAPGSLRTGREPLARIVLLVITLIVSVTAPLAAAAEGKTEATVTEVDHVALAGQLVRDGHYDRAKSVLSSVRPDDPNVNPADYHTISGLVALHEQAWQGAIDHLDRAIFAGKTDDVLFVYLAQAYWGLQDYQKTLQMIRNAAEAGEEIASLQLMRAQSLWKAGELHDAWRVLRRGSMQFDHPRFDRLMMFILVELGLFQEASSVATAYFDRNTEITAEDYVAFGQALVAGGELEQAALFLEKASLLWPDDRRVTTMLANIWAERGKPLAAAQLLQRAAITAPELAHDSAEMFRRAGALESALHMNAQIDDQKKKFRQRVAILTDRGDFESVAAMSDRLDRLDLLDDQNVLYAVAYARFQVGDYDATELLLKRIEDPALFEAATKLRQVMAYCSENSC